MPNNSPDVWTQIWAFLTLHFSNHNQVICATVIAAGTSFTKSFLYGKKDTPRRVLAEAVLCSIIAGSLQPVLNHLNLASDLMTPIGVLVGLVGTSLIRQSILRLLNKYTGANNE